MRYVTLTVALLFLLQALSGQVRQRRTELNRLVSPATRLSEPQQEEASRLFERVADGMRSASAPGISQFFNASVYLALPGLDQGEFSRDQAAQVLAGYLQAADSASLEVVKKETTTASPFLSATVRVRRGGAETEQKMYVSLTWTGTVWKIGHFSLY